MPQTTQRDDSPPSLALPEVRLMGVPIHRLSAREALHYISSRARAGEGGWVVTPNLDILRRLVVDREFAELCEGASLRLADGMPLIWASRLQGTPLPERVAGSDLIWSLTSAAAEEGLSVFLLGGNPGAAEQAAAEFKRKHPRLLVSGFLCPPLGFEKDPAQLEHMQEVLTGAQPQIVFVALGSPKQEQLIRRLRSVLPKAWFLGIGISFSFVSGEVARAPVWMRRIGLEWLHRLAQDPGRLFRRYVLHGIPFALRLLSVSAARGLRRKAPTSPAPAAE